MALLGASVFAWRDQAEFLVRRHELVCPWLPDRLRGLTIAHVSDLHVGRLLRPAMLPRVVDAVNALDSDLLLVTGDLVDNSNDLLPPALDAIGHMRHRYGRFICIGNHDEIDDRDAFIRQVRSRFDLLINRRRSLEIGGERLCIAGIDYAGSDEPTPRRPGHRRNVSATLDLHDAAVEGPIIALAHHPHTWDALRDAGVPLTLSGHTHGGQLMVAPPGSGFERGAGELLFRYIRGFFGDERSRLFVNSGVGNWFPVRINAPAEIVQMRLI
jgi:predicted MPP superfamily phosphohydrolase